MRTSVLLRSSLPALLLLLHVHLWANNIQVTNVSLTDQNTTGQFTMIEFDISWENSWRLDIGPSNWDAAWVFVKYRVGGGPWQHAYLNDDGHVAPAGSTIETGLVDPGSQYNPPSNPIVGVFIFRAAAGTGTFSLSNVRLRWNYGENGVDDDAVIDIKVFAIEHVLVPEGSFYLGSGGNEMDYFFSYSAAMIDPYEVTSGGEIQVGTSSGYLYYSNNSGVAGDQMGPIPASFPNGYHAFYLMKYEVSQQAYVDFLNTLNREQQNFCVNSSIVGGGPYQDYVMPSGGSFSPLHRNGIRVSSIVASPPSPITFFNDLNDNDNPNEEADGGTIACNFIRWAQASSFLDWAGLRPLTELEYEKAARGPTTPVPNEFAWGNVLAHGVSVIYEPGTPAESIDGLANCSFGAVNVLEGPFRCGCFARPNSGREGSGAGYFGALNLSDNLREIIITVGNPDGRSFSGTHGDGSLPNSGSADVLNWPDPLDPNAAGSGLRGGAWNQVRPVSDRDYAAFGLSTATPILGFRGARTRL